MVIISKKDNQNQWLQAIQKLDPDINIQIYPEDEKREVVKFALVWQPPMGVFKKYPNLKVIASMGAGVDHILKDPDLPSDLVVTRIIDDRLTTDMCDYLVTAVMNHLRNFSEYRDLQNKLIWKPQPYAEKAAVKIGIMGMGVLGRAAATSLINLGFSVHGWARSDKTFSDLKVYFGRAAFEEFLNTTSILICLLPLTDETINLLNKTTLSQLPQGAYIINVARGEQIVVDDLLQMLDSGHLAGACLDVFREEPLSNDHPFWRHPKIMITPHIASITNIDHVAPQIVDNYIRLSKGEPLKNIVSRKTGY